MTETPLDFKNLPVALPHFSGWLFLEKPCGFTSAGVVGKLRKHLQRYLDPAQKLKIGHGGTLDPFADGLLPIAIGEATKTSAYMMDHFKTYRFQIRWGISTDTLDREGKIVHSSSRLPSTAEILDAIPDFLGKIWQTPPAYSAIKVDGKRAYELARKGKPPTLAKREVWISSLQFIDSPEKSLSTFEVTCSKGTYVRTIAQDLAKKLQADGHVETLTRLAIGPFSLKNSIPLVQALSILPNQFETLPSFISLECTLQQTFTPLILDSHQVSRLLQGKPLSLAHVLHRDILVDNFSSHDYNRQHDSQAFDLCLQNILEKNLVVWSQHEAIAIVHILEGMIRTKCVFHHRKKPIYMKGIA